MDRKSFPDDLIELNKNHESSENEECMIRKLGLVEYFPERPGEFLWHVIESANVWISFTDCQGTVTLWNKYAEKIFGLAAGEVRGKELLPLLYPTEEVREKLREDFALQIKKTGKVLDYATTVTIPTGEEYQFSLNITPWIRNEECLGYLQFGVNLTEVREAKQRVKNLNKLLEASYAISQQMAQATDVEALLQEVCQTLVNARDYMLVSVTLLDEQEQRIDILDVKGNLKKSGEEPPIPGFEDQAIRTVVRTKQPYVCQDIYQVSDFQRWFPENRELGISAFITVPMGAYGTIVGALTLFFSRVNSIDNEEINLLQSVANDLASAIQSIRISYNLNALQEVSLSITDTRKLGSVFELVLRACVKLTRAGSGFIYLSNNTNGVVANYGEKFLSLGDSVPNSLETLINKVLEDGETLIRNHGVMGHTGMEYTVMDHTRETTKKKETFGENSLTSLMLIPMLVKGQSLGVLGLVNSPGGFSESDFKHCYPFAAQLAMAVMKTKLFEDVNSALEEAEASAHSFRTIFETAADLILIVDSAGIILKCNSRVATMLGYAIDEVEGESMGKLVVPGDVEEIHRLLEYTYKVGNKYNGEYRFVNSQNIPIDVEINAAFLKNKGVGDCVLMLVRDITERKRFQEELKYLTLHDSMTGLYNRRYFEDELKRLDVRRHGPITIISCDVDGLKLANDTLGDNKGDEIIKAAAKVIKRPFRSSDVVARVGGDEFGVILPFTDEEVAHLAKLRIKDSLEAFNKENPDIPLSLSVGSATSNSETSLENLFYESDVAMYRHKSSRGDRSLDAIIKILMLGLGEKDFVSQGHVERVRKLSADFGEALALTPIELNQLDILAQTHDIGNIGVSEAIISKPGELNEEERREVENHSELGYRMAASTPELVRIADALVQHHEWWNGEGYPHGLKGEQILFLARIFAIVDAYDAMTSYRPYRDPYSSEEALQEIKQGAGTQFDPELVEIFEKMLVSLSEK